jgi:Rab GDP dissociation inhibitor
MWWKDTTQLNVWDTTLTSSLFEKLHIDRNDHYGGESASINLEALFKRYGNYQEGTEPWKKYGRVNDWNIDLVPKLLMSNGELTNILVSTDVTRYLEFKQIAGSYVQQGNGAKATVAKVPSDASEALRSPLMGMFEKRRAKNFLQWVGNFDESNPSTHNGMLWKKRPGDWRRAWSW